jgi:hypothetical protein
MTERLRGTTPPPGSDMTLEPFFNDGCIDASTIAYWGQRVVWASSRGIYMTDGAAVVDLTASAQMKTYWTSLFTGYADTWRIAAGVYRGHYIISINNGSTLVDCLCVDLASQSMWRLTNLHGGTFVGVTTGQQEELYMGQWNAGRVAKLSTLWSPSATVKRDGDNTVPTPIIETGAFRGYDRLHRRWIQSTGKQKWRYLYVDYDLRDSASDNPILTMSYATSPDRFVHERVRRDAPRDDRLRTEAAQPEPDHRRCGTQQHALLESGRHWPVRDGETLHARGGVQSDRRRPALMQQTPLQAQVAQILADPPQPPRTLPRLPHPVRRSEPCPERGCVRSDPFLHGTDRRDEILTAGRVDHDRSSDGRFVQGGRSRHRPGRPRLGVYRPPVRLGRGWTLPSRPSKRPRLLIWPETCISTRPGTRWSKRRC